MGRASSFDPRRVVQAFLTRRFVRFVAVGGSNFALTYAIYILLLQAAMRPGLALLAANATGIVYTSTLNARVVFSVRLDWSALWPQFTYYLIYSFAYATALEMVVGQHLLRPEIAPLPLLCLAIPLNFFVTRLLVSRRPVVEA